MRVLAGDPERTDLQPEDMSWTVRCDDEFAITAVRLPAAQPSWAFVVQEADRCDVGETVLDAGSQLVMQHRVLKCSRASRLQMLHIRFMQPPLCWLSAAQPFWALPICRLTAHARCQGTAHVSRAQHMMMHNANRKSPACGCAACGG